ADPAAAVFLPQARIRILHACRKHRRAREGSHRRETWRALLATAATLGPARPARRTAPADRSRRHADHAGLRLRFGWGCGRQAIAFDYGGQSVELTFHFVGLRARRIQNTSSAREGFAGFLVYVSLRRPAFRATPNIRPDRYRATRRARRRSPA